MADLVLGLAKSAVEGSLTMARSAMEEEEKLQKSVQRDLMLISDEFEMMHSFLSATKENVTDDMTRTLVRQVREAALDVEDCIESVVHLDNRSNWWRCLLPSCMPASAPATSLDEAVADLELLKSRVEAMGQRNMRYGLISNSKPTETRTHQTPATRATKPFDILVEARNPMNKKTSPKGLVELISRSSSGRRSSELINKDASAFQPPQVISVWGSRDDLGTTSIIKKAYDDPEICKDFQCRAWVRLMHPFSPHEFIRSLLTQLHTDCYRQHRSTMADSLKLMTELMVAAEGILLEELMKQLNSLRYLIVLEDVSTMVDWEAVRVFLADNGNGNCVVVHTQQLEIASLCVGHSQRVLELERLSDDHSICAFFKDEDSNDDKETAKTKSAREWLHGFQCVGRQTNFWGLKSKIMHDTAPCISICGIAGVGKSSLVRQVYCTMVIERGPFENFGWVDMPNPFDLKELSRNLLLDLHSGSLHHVSMLRIKDPVQECKQLLQQYKCLIVTNDLKLTEEWDSIKADLVGHNHQSYIIVIAHEESIARYCTNQNWGHVEGLEIEEALDLFKITVCKKIGSYVLSRGVYEKAKHILHMCGGLPRVIIAVADFVAERLYNVEGAMSHLKHSFMKTLEEHPAFGRLCSLFAWVHSYFRSCPDFLKPCVFYLSIFPLNHSIRRRRLVWRWVAEGYTRDSQDRNAEKNAEEFVMKLFLLSVIQVPGQRVLTNYMKMPLCHVNGFLREYIVSRTMEDNLVFVLNGHCRASSQRTGRHLTIESTWDKDRVMFQSIDFSRLRSLTVFGQWEPFFVSNKMVMLRVLDLEDTTGVTNQDVDRMVKLMPRLKFLSLRGCEAVTCLPESLGSMRYLQTLDVRYTSIVKLPQSITKLHKLQYIRAGNNMPVLNDDDQSMKIVLESHPGPSESAGGVGAYKKLWTRYRHRWLPCSPNGGVKVPRGIGHLMALHTLGVINVAVASGRAILKELKNLTQLRKLGVSGINQRNCHELCSAISGHVHLESLSVRLEKGSRGCLDNGLSVLPAHLSSLKLYGDAECELPAWMGQLHNLFKLTVEMVTITEQGMDVLAYLPRLRALHLRFKEFQDGELEFSEGFHRLNVLEISCNSSLETLTFCPGVMKTLELLKLHFCGDGVSPTRIFGLQELSALNEIWLNGWYEHALEEHLQGELERHPRKINLVIKKEPVPS